MLKEMVFVFAVLVVSADATVVNHCNSDIPFEDTTQISISGCDKPKCLFKQGTNITIQIILMPDKDIQSLTNDVKEIITFKGRTGPRNFSFPYMTIDGTNACDNIYIDGNDIDGNKSGCPLKKGVQYVYKNSFPVSAYSPISIVIHYALQEGNDRVICFEVPSKFTE